MIGIILLLLVVMVMMIITEVHGDVGMSYIEIMVLFLLLVV